MIIVEYSYYKDQHELKTKTLETAAQVITLAASHSEKFDHFNIVRINKYIDGRLVPMEIAVNKGRIELVPKVDTMDDTEARMRMIAERQAKIPGNPPAGWENL